MKNIGLKTQSEFKEWAKSEKRPNDIPYSPEKTYKDKGYKGMGDFLGKNE